MTIKDFLDFGFTITYEQTDSMGNWVYVCKDEDEYAKTFEFCKVARTYQEIVDGVIKEVSKKIINQKAIKDFKKGLEE